MYCPTCGTKNPDTAAFCISCGESLALQETVVQAPPTQQMPAATPVVPPQSYAEAYPPPAPAPKKEGALHKLGSLPLWAILLAALLIIGGVAVARSGILGGPGNPFVPAKQGDYVGTWVAEAEADGMGLSGSLNLMETGDAELTITGSAFGFSMDIAAATGTWELEDGKVALISDDIVAMVDQINSYVDSAHKLSYDGKIMLEPKGNTLVLSLGQGYTFNFERR